jgi:hypothetical protein
MGGRRQRTCAAVVLRVQFILAVVAVSPTYL